MSDSGARILVVDDVGDNRDLLLRRLRRLGFTDIDQAADGVEALAAIAGKAYDLVLLDIMMPNLDGFGVLERLRSDGLISSLPVIVISALSEIEPVVRCIELGAEDFIFKPFNPTLLRARVLATLEKKALADRIRGELHRKHLELNEARSLQLSLLPERFAGVVGGQNLTIDRLLEPAMEVGGDVLDFLVVGPDLLVLMLGDVSDKGAGAAMMMARTQAMFRSLAGRPDAAELFREPARAVGMVNAALSSGNANCVFVTFLMACFEPASGRLVYVRAGHIPPYRRNGAGEVSRLECPGGPPLGLSESVRFREGEVTLAPGDRLLVVTDGITEAANSASHQFGEGPVGTFLASIATGEGEPLQRLLGEVRAHEAGQPPSDDIAAILLTLEAR